MCRREETRTRSLRRASSPAEPVQLADLLAVCLSLGVIQLPLIRLEQLEVLRIVRVGRAAAPDVLLDELDRDALEEDVAVGRAGLDGEGEVASDGDSLPQEAVSRARER